MPLIFSDAVIADLGGLSSLSAPDFVSRGAQNNIFNKVGLNLGKSGEDIKGMVMSLTHAFLEAAKLGVSDAELVAAITDKVDLSAAAKESIAATYRTNKDKLRAHCAGADTSDIPQYKNLDWRMEIIVAQKDAHDCCVPSFTLRLDTSADGATLTPSVGASTEGIQATYMTADYLSLKRVCDSLDEAAAELKTPHSKRVARYIR